jgi:hypothetical protein
MQVYLQGQPCTALNPSDRAVDKRLEFLYPIKDSLDLHLAPFGLADDELALSSDQRLGRDAPLINYPAFYPQILRKSRKSLRCPCTMRATFFIGSIFDRMTRLHQLSRNRPAQ